LVAVLSKIETNVDSYANVFRKKDDFWLEQLLIVVEVRMCETRMYEEFLGLASLKQDVSLKQDCCKVCI